MDDITYTYNQTNRERKGMANSAKKRINGSKSHKCTLPSDHLTPAQQRKLNGPVREYNIVKPMSWADFMAMPKDLQEAHLNYIAQRFRVGAGTISSVVFSLDSSRVPHYCKLHGLNYPVRGGKTSDATRAAIKAWVTGEDEITEDEPTPTMESLLSEDFEPDEPELPDKPEIPVEPVSSDEPAEPATPKTRNPITSATLRMEGAAKDILDALARVIGAGKVTVDVNITFIKEEN